MGREGKGMGKGWEYRGGEGNGREGKGREGGEGTGMEGAPQYFTAPPVPVF